MLLHLAARVGGGGRFHEQTTSVRDSGLQQLLRRSCVLGGGNVGASLCRKFRASIYSSLGSMFRPNALILPSSYGSTLKTAMNAHRGTKGSSGLFV